MRMLFGLVGDTKGRFQKFWCDEARDNRAARQAEESRDRPSSDGSDSDVHGRFRVFELRDVIGT